MSEVLQTNNNICPQVSEITQRAKQLIKFNNGDSATLHLYPGSSSVVVEYEDGGQFPAYFLTLSNQDQIALKKARDRNDQEAENMIIQRNIQGSPCEDCRVRRFDGCNPLVSVFTTELYETNVFDSTIPDNLISSESIYIGRVYGLIVSPRYTQ